MLKIKKNWHVLIWGKVIYWNFTSGQGVLPGLYIWMCLNSIIIFKNLQKKKYNKLAGFPFPRQTLKTQCLSHQPSAQLEMWARPLRLLLCWAKLKIMITWIFQLTAFLLISLLFFAGYYFGRMGGHHVLRHGCPLLLQFYIFYITYYSKYTLIEGIS